MPQTNKMSISAIAFYERHHARIVGAPLDGLDDQLSEALSNAFFSFSGRSHPMEPWPCALTEEGSFTPEKSMVPMLGLSLDGVITV